MRRGYPAQEVMRVLALEDAFARAGRNEPCPCGSGLKFKRCHGRKDRKANKEKMGQVTHVDSAHPENTVKKNVTVNVKSDT
jgi:uncharacterized protein